MLLWSKNILKPSVIGLIVLFTSSNLFLFGQKSYVKKFLDKKYVSCDSIGATYYEIVEKNQSDTSDFQKTKLYKLNEVLLSEKEFYAIHNKEVINTFKSFDTLGNLIELTNYRKEFKQGPFIKYYSSGKIKTQGTYHQNELDDSLFSYYENGILKRKDLYCFGQLISGQCLSSNGSDTIYFPYQQQASFPGGMNKFYAWLNKNLVYPQSALEKHVTGKVYIKFTVELDGSITNFIVVRGLAGCPECDKETLRVFSIMPQWNPEIIEEVAIISHYQCPIIFNLE